MNKFQRNFARAETTATLPRPEVQNLLVNAFQHHHGGNFGVAAAEYQKVLALDPNQPDALHLLGVLAHQLGDHQSAVGLIGQSVSINPANADAHNNLGNALFQLGQLSEAEQAYRTAISVNPDGASAHFNLANVLHKSERAEEAIAEYDLALLNQPTYADAHFNRSAALVSLERFEEAVTGYQNVLSADPHRASIHTNLGSAYAGLKRFDDAHAQFTLAIERDPLDALAYANLGNVLGETGKRKEAIPYHEKAHALDPQNIEIRFGLARALMSKSMSLALPIAEATAARPDARARDWYLLGAIQTSGRATLALKSFEKARQLDPMSVYESNHLGVAYMDNGMIDQAISFFHQMLGLDPNNDITYSELGVAYKDLGDVPLALETMRKGLAIKPNADCHSNLLFTLYYSNDYTAQMLLEEAKTWAATYTPNVPRPPLARPREGRKIRIGYLSADFHEHPAGYLYQALLPEHDRARFEIYLYLNQDRADAVTEQIVQSADEWRIVKSNSDEELAEIVREDEIDVFVDLLGHTNNHRLEVFGLRPAPVQVSWLGYFGTTGMQQMDYIIADKYTLPEGEEQFYTEAPARMPGCMYVFQTPEVKIQPSTPPMVKNGHPTFGCFNNTPKITPEVVALWCQVMREIPDSRMILNRWPFRTEMVRDRYRKLFEENGVSGDRVEFRATKGRQAYFESFNEVDIILDTFPFGGGTTTSGALWMGVPVVSLPSDRLVGHMNETIFHAVGLEDLVISTPEEYVALAKSLAGDLSRLQHYRKTLRKQTEDSPLCDLSQFARDLEGVFEWMVDETIVRAAA